MPVSLGGRYVLSILAARPQGSETHARTLGILAQAAQFPARLQLISAHLEDRRGLPFLRENEPFDGGDAVLRCATINAAGKPGLLIDIRMSTQGNVALSLAHRRGHPALVLDAEQRIGLQIHIAQKLLPQAEVDARRVNPARRQTANSATLLGAIRTRWREENSAVSHAVRRHFMSKVEVARYVAQRLNHPPRAPRE